MAVASLVLRRRAAQFRAALGLLRRMIGAPECVFPSARARLLRCITLGAALAGAPAAWAGDTLTIPGTGAFEVLLARLAAAFNAHERADVIVVPSSVGSGGGIRAVLDGKAVLARVARPLKQSEAAEGLRYVAFARDAVVFAVGTGVDVRGVSARNIADIYEGRVMNWKALGGADTPVRPLTREPTETVLKLLAEQFPAIGGALGADVGKMVTHDYEMVQMLDKYPGAIGFTTRNTLASARTAVRVLAVDSSTPTPEALASGSYRATVDAAFVYREGQLTPLAQRFVKFVLSGEGRQVVRDMGLVPLERR